MSLITITLAVGLIAGIVRGFAGFGGPSVMIASLTVFMTPLEVINMVLLVEFLAATYLVIGVRGEINWPMTAALTVPALIAMWFGHLVLINADADIMRRVILCLILGSALVMLANFRLPGKYSLPALAVVGVVGGTVIGASYVALVLAALILLAPYNRNETRTLIVISGFFFAAWYVALSVYRDQTTMEHVRAAIPVGIAYFSGSWLGAYLFRYATEANYRQYTLLLLVALSVVGLYQSL